MSFISKYEFDIFVSYAHADGRAELESLCEDLAAELNRRLPGRERPAIFLDKHALRAGDHIDSAVAAGLQNSALFLAIVSPKYHASPACKREELGGFQALHGAASDRIFQLIRYRSDEGPPIPECLWIDYSEKAVREQAMERLIDGLSARLIQLRRQLVQLYIAWPGPFGEKDRACIEGEFRPQGYAIRPDSAFNEFTRDEVIQKEIQDSDLSIHIFNISPDALAERQYRIACELGKPAFIVTRNPEEPRPAIYLGDPNAIGHLGERLKRRLGSRNPPLSDATRQVFLLYKPDQDWSYADDLTQMLRDRGAEVFPPSDPYPDPFLNLDEHVDDLRQSAAIVLCWGDAPREWLDGVDRKLSSLRIRDKQLGKLTRAKYFVEPPLREARSGRNEFIIRKEQDLDPFLKAAGLGR